MNIRVYISKEDSIYGYLLHDKRFSKFLMLSDCLSPTDLPFLYKNMTDAIHEFDLLKSNSFYIECVFKDNKTGIRFNIRKNSIHFCLSYSTLCEFIYHTTICAIQDTLVEYNLNLLRGEKNEY